MFPFEWFFVGRKPAWAIYLFTPDKSLTAWWRRYPFRSYQWITALYRAGARRAPRHSRQRPALKPPHPIAPHPPFSNAPPRPAPDCSARRCSQSFRTAPRPSQPCRAVLEGNFPSHAQHGAEQQPGGALHDGAVEGGVARRGAIGSSAGRNNQVRGIT